MSLLDDIINGIWDLVFSDQLEALQGIFDFLINLPNLFAEMFVALTYLFAYPFIALLGSFHFTLNYFWQLVTQMFNLPIDLINYSIVLVDLAFPGFPPVWIWLLSLTISIRVGMIIIRWIWAIIP